MGMCLRLPNRNRVKVTRMKEGLDIASDSCCQSRGLRRPINVNVYDFSPRSCRSIFIG